MCGVMVLLWWIISDFIVDLIYLVIVFFGLKIWVILVGEVLMFEFVVNGYLIVSL